MKFKDLKTGEVFEESDDRFCGIFTLYTGCACTSKNCEPCPICSQLGGVYHDCKTYVRDHPTQAAALMGYDYLGDTSTDTSTDKLQYINSVYGRDEIFCQTAEESVELAQACDDLRRVSMRLSKAVLKLRRAEHGTTPVSLTEATRAVLEECADVTLCIRAVESLGVFSEMELLGKIAEKLDRWKRRAREYEKRVDRKP